MYEYHIDKLMIWDLKWKKFNITLIAMTISSSLFWIINCGRSGKKWDRPSFHHFLFPSALVEVDKLDLTSCPAPTFTRYFYFHSISTVELTSESSTSNIEQVEGGL